MKSMNGRRMAALLLIIVFSLFFGGLLFAQTSYVDIGIKVPFSWGLGSTELDGDISGAVDYVFPVPDINYGLMFGDGPLTFGVGARFFTIILESLVYPQLMFRGEFDPLVVTASAGGGAFLYFGLANGIGTPNIITSEITGAYKVNDWFQLGLGTTIVYAFADNDVMTGGYAYPIYVFGRFALGGN
jgi:hypothetical protein